jgi:hypothetical protein
MVREAFGSNTCVELSNLGLQTSPRRGWIGWRLRAFTRRCPIRKGQRQFSASASEAVALVVGARSNEQILEDYNSMHAKIPASFWQELKHEKLIEPNAPVPEGRSFQVDAECA